MISIIISSIIALFAIVILYLTRNNIIDLLDRDVIMYDENFQQKKESFEEAFNCLDLVAQNGVDIKNNPQFIARAKEAYNGLLCTASNPKIYQEFYAKAIDTSSPYSSVEDIEKFKITCRAELFSKRRKKGEGFKGSSNGSINMSSFSQSAQKPTPRPVQPKVPQVAQRPLAQQKPQNPRNDE